jgi:diguanylate cyclase
MATNGDEHERTIAFAEIAIGQIKALRQPATPRNFELWYAYATGCHPELNEAINNILSRRGGLTDTEIENICSTYLPSIRASERIDTAESRVVDEIDQVMAMVNIAIGSTSGGDDRRAGMSRDIRSADREDLRAIVESLVGTSKEMEDVNYALEERLSASKLEISQLQRNLELARNESLTDPLTSLSNRKFFDEQFSEALAKAAAANEALSLLLIDIDHFKTFNDTYGHLTGDQVLRLVAVSVKQNVRGHDTAARYGGEEFAIILPNTMLFAAVTVADHIRRDVMGKEFMKRSTGEHLGHVTISVGVATLRPGDTAQSLIGRADACLYLAKHRGRNRVVCEADAEFARTSAPATAVA